MKPVTHVIIEKATGKAIIESPLPTAKFLEELKTAKYEAVPLLTYLQNIKKDKDK